MELGLGWLRMRPDDFWNMTLRELTAAMDGLIDSKGGESPRKQAEKYDELLAFIETVPSSPA